MIKRNNCLLGHRWGSKTPSTWSFSANTIEGITSRPQSSAPLSGDFDTDHYLLQIRVFAESSLEALGKLFVWNSLLQVTPLVVSLFYRRWWGALKGLKAIVLIFSNGHSLEESKEKSSITMMRKKKMGVRLNVHEGLSICFSLEALYILTLFYFKEYFTNQNLLIILQGIEKFKRLLMLEANRKESQSNWRLRTLTGRS